MVPVCRTGAANGAACRATEQAGWGKEEGSGPPPFSCPHSSPPSRTDSPLVPPVCLSRRFPPQTVASPPMNRIEPVELAQRLQTAVQGEFEVGRLLGQGGFASVFLARDLMLARDVAIKVLDPNLAFSGEHSERFLTEARLVAALEHPHIMPIYQVEQKNGLLYIVMRFVPGTSLGGLLAKQGR